MRNSITARAGAALLAGALVLGSGGVAQAAPAPAAHSWPHHHHYRAHKVRIIAKGGAYVRARAGGHARVVAHLGLGAVVVLGGPVLFVHGVLWLRIRGGGWICARDVRPLRA
ncbi:MAG TPA: hypothetical protein VF053_02820 [Streptosporangiales bacterium]